MKIKEVLKSKEAKIILILFLVILLLVFGKELKNISVEEIVSFAENNKLLAPLVILGLYCIKATLFVIPISLLYISTGLIFTPIQAIIINILGLILELTITFYLGKFLGEEKVKSIISKNEKMKKLNYRSLTKGKTVFLVRFVPIFPVDFISLLLGTIGKDYMPYLVPSVLGILPRMIPLSLMGNSLTNPFSIEFLLPLIILGALGFIGIKIYNR